MTTRLPFIPYPPIEQHGVIGDRRTAALVAADGAVTWLCLPDYDGASIFGALLDAERGGFWRFGPAVPALGRQSYVDESAALATNWATEGAELELIDALVWPQDQRPSGSEQRRVLVRRLRCLNGEAAGVLEFRPRFNFDTPPAITPASGGLRFKVGELALSLWASCPIHELPDGNGASAAFRLRQGQEVWAVLALDEDPATWTIERAQGALKTTISYWHGWHDHLAYTGPRGAQVRRSALTVHLLSYAPSGSLVAAPTTSLPERVGGNRNYDYRFAWVRDASLSMAVLSLLGNTTAARRYMDWLAGLGSSTDSPLQVVYRINGETDLTQRERRDLAGYRESLPVRTGNHAFSQLQLDSLGYLADCALIYLQQGGAWREEYWSLIRDAASFTVANWREPDSGIWEFPIAQHYVSSKVMSWVTLERAVKIARKTGRAAETNDWVSTMQEIHAEVMDRGWSERLGAFRQRYEADSLDAAALLIPVMRFLPAKHPRVLATANRIAESLTIDGFVHRFIAGETPGHEDLALGEFEGAFLPCTFWLATTYAMAGRPNQAEAILTKAEAVAGELGLFAEEVDARSGTFLGNTPLLFSQVEYVRAIVELARARPRTMAQLMLGMLKRQISRSLRPTA